MLFLVFILLALVNGQQWAIGLIYNGPTCSGSPISATGLISASDGKCQAQGPLNTCVPIVANYSWFQTCLSSIPSNIFIPNWVVAATYNDVNCSSLRDFTAMQNNSCTLLSAGQGTPTDPDVVGINCTTNGGTLSGGGYNNGLGLQCTKVNVNHYPASCSSSGPSVSVQLFCNATSFLRSAIASIITISLLSIISIVV